MAAALQQLEESNTLRREETERCELEAEGTHIHSLLVRRLCLRARSRMFCAAAGREPFIMSRGELTNTLKDCDAERCKELCERLAAGTLLLPCLPRRKFKGIGRCMMILANGEVAAAAGPYDKKRAATQPANEGITPGQASPCTRSEGGSKRVVRMSLNK